MHDNGLLLSVSDDGKGFDTNSLPKATSPYYTEESLSLIHIYVDLSPVHELVSLQRRCSNNLNQVAIQANTYGGSYPEEIKALQRDYEKLWRPLSDLLEKLSAIAVSYTHLRARARPMSGGPKSIT